MTLAPKSPSAGDNAEYRVVPFPNSGGGLLPANHPPSPRLAGTLRRADSESTAWSLFANSGGGLLPARHAPSPRLAGSLRRADSGSTAWSLFANSAGGLPPANHPPSPRLAGTLCRAASESTAWSPLSCALPPLCFPHYCGGNTKGVGEGLGMGVRTETKKTNPTARLIPHTSYLIPTRQFPPARFSRPAPPFPLHRRSRAGGRDP